MALSIRICLLALCLLLVPVAGAAAATHALAPDRREPRPARRLGAAAARAAPKPKPPTLGAARRADRGRGARRPVPLRRQLAEWVRLLRARRLRLREARDRLPHNAAAQYSYGRAVDRGHLKPGDLVFFHGLGHVGLYIGRGRIIHAPQSGERVSIQSLAVAQRQRRGRPPPHPQLSTADSSQPPPRRVVFGR